MAVALVAIKDWSLKNANWRQQFTHLYKQYSGEELIRHYENFQTENKKLFMSIAEMRKKLAVMHDALKKYGM